MSTDHRDLPHAGGGQTDMSPIDDNTNDQGKRAHSAYPDFVSGPLLTLAKAIKLATIDLSSHDYNVDTVRDNLYTALVTVRLAGLDLDTVQEGVDPHIDYYCFVGDEIVTFLPQFTAVDDYLYLPARRRADAALLEVLSTFHQSASNPFKEGTTDSTLMDLLDVHDFQGSARHLILEKARRLATLGVTSDILTDVDEAHIVRTFTV